jgi:hypothetical protein
MIHTRTRSVFLELKKSHHKSISCNRIFFYLGGFDVKKFHLIEYFKTFFLIQSRELFFTKAGLQNVMKECEKNLFDT